MGFNRKRLFGSNRQSSVLLLRKAILNNRSMGSVKPIQHEVEIAFKRGSALLAKWDELAVKTDIETHISKDSLVNLNEKLLVFHQLDDDCRTDHPRHMRIDVEDYTYFRSQLISSLSKIMKRSANWRSIRSFSLCVRDLHNDIQDFFSLNTTLEVSSEDSDGYDS
ncbi:uncharacterized protein LOC128959108 [Oppia nitens]|uniref:uncharacterized protein LOC128959108 n=1 Tax=Oppia nitens TaxID=1686743 RepID=UPI0023DC8F18|nr:uncharacterized protein LOC128959108 [Oppia nitens]